MLKEYPLYLANDPIRKEEKLDVFDKYTGDMIGRVSLADKDSIEKALSAAVDATPLMRKMQSFERKEILQYCVKRFLELKSAFIDILCMEVGKTLNDAKSEFDRFIGTFDLSAEEATRIYGEVLPLDIGPRGRGFCGLWQRVPIGPCLFITPFNFPINLAAHKIAPAIAVGCPFILKPASLTPISALMIAEVLAETSLPKGAFSILPCPNALAEILVADPRLKLLSFTGSDKVGWDLKIKAQKKQVVLELGGNAACIIDQHVDLEYVAQRLIFGAFYMTGQSCISVQRIYAHQDVYADLREKLIQKANALKVGDPKLTDTFVGPLISLEAAERLETWINEAIQMGSKLLCGGKRKGAVLEPTLLEGVGDTQKLNCMEAFGPIAVLEPFTDFEDVLTRVNQSRYGLQAGLFTRDIFHCHRAFEKLEVGGLMINEVPSWRSDNMPYGGTKDSGIGREGVRFAIEHLTEIRMMAMHFP